VDAYKEDPGNPRYAFRVRVLPGAFPSVVQEIDAISLMYLSILMWQHLLFSVTDPSQRVKPVAASDVRTCIIALADLLTL
jgi:nuclear pore complex protein Nup54